MRRAWSSPSLTPCAHKLWVKSPANMMSLFKKALCSEPRYRKLALLSKLRSLLGGRAALEILTSQRKLFTIPIATQTLQKTMEKWWGSARTELWCVATWTTRDRLSLTVILSLLRVMKQTGLSLPKDSSWVWILSSVQLSKLRHLRRAPSPFPLYLQLFKKRTQEKSKSRILPK